MTAHPAALTEQQWQNLDNGRWVDVAHRLSAFISGEPRALCIAGDNIEDGMDLDTPQLPALIALANDALPAESPYRFDAHDLTVLDEASRYLWLTGRDEQGAEIDGLHAKLAALLRPTHAPEGNDAP